MVVRSTVDLVLCYDWLSVNRGGAAVRQRPAHLRSVRSRLRPVHTEELWDDRTWRSTNTNTDESSLVVKEDGGAETGPKVRVGLCGAGDGGGVVGRNSPSAGDEEEEEVERGGGAGAGGRRGDTSPGKTTGWISDVQGAGLVGGEVLEGAFDRGGVESVSCDGEFGGRGALGCVKVVVEEEEEEKKDGVGEGEELGAVEEELAGPAVGETSGRKNKKRERGAGRSSEGTSEKCKPPINFECIFNITTKH